MSTSYPGTRRTGRPFTRCSWRTCCSPPGPRRPAGRDGASGRCTAPTDARIIGRGELVRRTPMFAVMLGVGCFCGQLADDPVAAVQRRYPVHRTAVTSSSGTVVHYTLPADAPPELRLAYKVLEVAEREVLVSEALQLLELDYVNNERKLEGLRTAYAAWYLRSPNTQGPRFYGF